MTTPGATFENRVRDHRQRRGWSQDELARRSGLSRPEVSAIETGRVVPSTAAALALALALAVRVEDLFRLAGGPEPGGPDQGGWAWPPSSRPGRFWRAEVGGRIRLYPVEVSPLGLPPHDGAWVETGPRLTSWSDPSETLVMACCDPAANVLAAELARTSRVRLLVLPRSSQAALELLRRGLVHVAGLHLARADAADGHAALARERLGGDARLERVARWEDGLAFAPGSAIGSARQALAPRRRWVGREAGSGARSCQGSSRPSGAAGPTSASASARLPRRRVWDSWASARRRTTCVTSRRWRTTRESRPCSG
jgi:transcriptional regulator with XRE-family HTH domain